MALNWATQELHIVKRHLICRAIEVWAMNPTLKPWQPSGKGVHAHVSVGMSDEDVTWIKTWCIEFDARPSQIVESALSRWFEEYGFLARVQSGEISQAERQQIARSAYGRVERFERDDSPEEILRKQLEFYTRTGNALRITRIRRELLAMGVAA
nr:hypothetical protein [Synechococcus elongatus]